MSTRYEDILDEVLASVDLAGVKLTKEKPRSWSTDEAYHLEDQDVRVQLVPPTEGADNEELAGGLMVESRALYDGITARETPLAVRLLQVAAVVQAQFNERIADEVAAAKAAAEEAERQRVAEVERKRVLAAERKERLLNEFVGVECRIRLAGYKRFRPGKLDAQEDNSGEYTPVLIYKYDRYDRYREWWQDDRWVAFQVKVPGSTTWHDVWNDGWGDMGTYDQPADPKTFPKYDAAAEQL